jgi:hypothetical protein
LIVEKSEIIKFTKIKEEKENFSQPDENIYSDINDLTFLQKRKREEPKKTKKDKKNYKNLFGLKIKKNYRNGDLDGLGNFYDEFMKSHKNKNRCHGCCNCINNKKKKSTKKNEENVNSNETIHKPENEKIEEDIKFPAFENPFMNLNSETINKNDFNLFHEYLTVYFSNLTSVINHKMRELDEKKSNKKKFQNINTNNERKPSRKKQKLTDYDKNDIARKINELNIKQLSDMVELFPDHVFKKEETISFNFNDFPGKVLAQFKEYVEKCYSDNVNNPVHLNYRKEIEVYSIY